MPSFKDLLESIWTALLKFFLLKRTGDAFADQVDIIYAIDRLVHAPAYEYLGLERVTIVKVHNDGEDIMPLSYKYFSIVYEDYRPPYTSIRHKYRGVAADTQYILMITELYKKKAIAVTPVPATNDRGMLHDILEVEKIAYSQLHFLKHTKKAFWYISFSTSKQDERFVTAEHRNEIYLTVSKIRKLLKQY